MMVYFLLVVIRIMNEELKTLIKEKLLSKNSSFVKSRISKFEKACPLQYQEIFNLTSFLSNDASIKERIHCICYDVTTIQICKSCGKKLRLFHNFNRGYQHCVNLYCIQENGLPKFENKRAKALKTINQVEANGLTRAQNIGKKAAETRKKIGKDGLTIDQINGLTISKTLKEIQENGLTRAQNRAIKSAKTMTTTICEDGLTLAKRIGIKASNTLKLVGEDGLTGYQKNGKKQSDTLRTIEENGLSYAQNFSKKTVKTKNIKNEDGLTTWQRSIKKMTETLSKVGKDGLTGYQRNGQKISEVKSKIGSDGLDSYDRGLMHGAGRCHLKLYNKSGLYYQGSLEKNFLDQVNQLGFLDQIVRSKQLFYELDGQRHLYHVDYQFNDVLFEIKSCWTYDSKGKDLYLRRKNNSKWKAAVFQGYELYIIWDKKWISFLHKNDFDNIERDLHLTKVPFTKQKLLNIFTNKVEALCDL